MNLPAMTLQGREIRAMWVGQADLRQGTSIDTQFR